MIKNVGCLLPLVFISIETDVNCMYGMEIYKYIGRGTFSQWATE